MLAQRGSHCAFNLSAFNLVVSKVNWFTHVEKTQNLKLDIYTRAFIRKCARLLENKHYNLVHSARLKYT